MERRNAATRRVLRHGPFRRLLGALAVSVFGDWLYGIAIVAYIFSRTHSAGWVAASVVARFVPAVILGPIAGALVDRGRRRRLMVASDVVRAALMAVLAVLSARHAGPVPVTAIALLSVVASTVYAPAVSAETPRLVGEADLPACNSVIGLVNNIASLAGPALGGALLAITSTTTSFALNGVTFVVSAVLVASLGREPVADAGRTSATEQPLLRSAAAGVGVLLGEARARALTLVCLGGYFLYGVMSVLLVVVSADRLGSGSRGLGYLFAAFGLGGIVAAAVTQRITDSPWSATLLFVGVAVFGIAFATLALPTSLPPALVVLAVAGLAAVAVDVAGITLLQRLLPDDALGRAFGTFDALNVVVTMLGYAVAAPLAHAVGLRTTLVAAGVGVPVVTALVLPALRRADRTLAAELDVIAPRVEALAGAALFAGSARPTLERVAAASLDRRVAAGTTVVAEGDEADAVYVVVDGRLTVTTGADDQPVRTLVTGDTFGEVGIVAGGRRTATVRSETETTLLEVPAAVFVDAAQASTATTADVLGVVAARLGRTHPHVQAPINLPEVVL